MEVKVICTTLLVLVLGPLYLGIGHVDALTAQQCSDNFLDTSMALLAAFKSNNRNKFKEQCQNLAYAQSECSNYMTSEERQQASENYNKICDSPKVNQWLRSTGSAIHGGALFVTLAFTLTIFRNNFM